MNISARRILTPSGWLDNYTLELQAETITALRPMTRDEQAGCLEGLLVPGFFDTQVNGGGGVLFEGPPAYYRLLPPEAP